MSFRLSAKRLEEIEEQRRRKARIKATKESMIRDKDFGTGKMLRAPKKKNMLEGLPGQPSRSERQIESIINERTDFPISREAARQQYNQETASKGIEMAKRRRKKADPPKSPKKEKGMDFDKIGQAAQLASQMGGGAGNILSGVAAGSSFGAPGMIAGGALGIAKNLAKRKKDKQALIASAIKGQSKALQAASKGERDALENMMAALRSSLIF